MGFNFPKEIEERPILIKMEGNKAVFKDGSTAEVIKKMINFDYGKKFWANGFHN